MHLSGRPLAKPYRTRAFFLRIFLPACKKLVVLGHFSFQFELRFFLIWSWSIPVGASKIRCSTRAFAVSKAAVTDHSRHGNAKCEQGSKSGSRASGSWVRIPPYPPRSRQQSVFPAAGVSFCADQTAGQYHPRADAHHRPPLRLYTVGRSATDHLCGYIQRMQCACAQKTNAAGVCRRARKGRCQCFGRILAALPQGGKLSC